MAASLPIFECIAAGDSPQVATLLLSSPSLAAAVNDDGISALLFAQYHRRTEIVDMLVAQGIALSIFEASAIGDFRGVQALIACDPHQVRSVSIDGYTPLHLAAFFGRPEIVTLLLQMGADSNAVAQNRSRVQPLHSAVAGRNALVVERLLLAGADVNAQQNGGFTPLDAALQNEDREIIALLRRGD